MTIRSFLVAVVLVLAARTPGQAQVIRQLQGHRAAVYALAFHPDGEHLATASLDHTLKLWKIGKGEEVRSFVGHRCKVLTLAFSPDGQRLASAGLDGEVRLWEITTDPASGPHEVTESACLHVGYSCIHSLAFTPDGKRLVCAGEDGLAEVWDAEHGKRLRSLPSLPCAVYSTAVSPDGSEVALAGLDHRIYLFDLQTGKQRQILEGHHEAVYSVAYSPDGTLATGSGDLTVRLWEPATGNPKGCLYGHREAIYQVAFSSDGRRLVSAGTDGEVIVWGSNSGQALHSHRFPSRTLCTAFTPDGRSIGAGTGQACCYLLELPRHVR